MNIMESLTEKIIRNTNIRQTMLKILTFQFNPFSENCSIAYDETGDAVIIDPGFYNEKEASALYSKIAEKGLLRRRGPFLRQKARRFTKILRFLN